MRSVSFTIPRLPIKEVRPNSRLSWRAKAQCIKEEREVGAGYATVAGMQSREMLTGGPFHKFRMSLDFYSQREIDLDNLLASCKFWVDGFQDAGLIESDKPSLMSYGRITWTKSTKADERVEILLEGETE